MSIISSFLCLQTLSLIRARTGRFSAIFFKASGRATVEAAGGGLASIQLFGYPTAYSDTFTTAFAGDANELIINAAPTQPFVIDRTRWLELHLHLLHHRHFLLQ